MADPVLLRIKRRADFLRATRARNSVARPGLVLQARDHGPDEGRRIARQAGCPRQASGPDGAAGPGGAEGFGADERSGADEGPGKNGTARPVAAGPIRVGFTASRKVGNAVARNRAKRRLRALADEILRAQAKPGADYVLIARQATATRAHDALRGDLVSALKRLGYRRAPDDAPAPEKPTRSGALGADRGIDHAGGA